MPSNTIGPFIAMALLGFVHIIITWLGLRGPSKEHDFHILLVNFLIAITFVNFLNSFIIYKHENLTSQADLF